MTLDLTTHNKILNTDLTFYTNISEVLRRGSAEIVESNEHGLLVYDRNSKVYMLTANNQNMAEALLADIPNIDMITVHQDYCIPYIENHYGIKVVMTCRQAVYQKEHPITIPDTGLSIRSLSIDEAEYISNRYAHSPGVSYIEGRIKAGEMFGGYYEDTLAGFIGVHEEGSLGMLEVFDEYRGKQFGQALMAYLVNNRLSLGLTPFSQIELDNDVSFHLHRKLGFTITDRVLYWMY